MRENVDCISQKGMGVRWHMVLEERGVSTVGKIPEWMRKTQGGHTDFRDEKSVVEKFHPELNPIERVWAQLK